MPDGDSIVQAAMDGRDYTLGQLFDTLDETGAGIVRLVFRDADDRPVRGVIAIDGVETCEPVLAAIEALEAAWRHA